MRLLAAFLLMIGLMEGQTGTVPDPSDKDWYVPPYEKPTNCMSCHSKPALPAKGSIRYYRVRDMLCAVNHDGVERCEPIEPPNDALRAEDKPKAPQAPKFNRLEATNQPKTGDWITADAWLANWINSHCWVEMPNAGGAPPKGAIHCTAEVKK